VYLLTNFNKGNILKTVFKEVHIMRFEYNNKGVCSKKTIVELDEDNIIKSVEIIGGCDGNRKGIMSLLKGVKAEEAIQRMEGITCGFKSTSCPDQVAKALKAAVEENN